MTTRKNRKVPRLLLLVLLLGVGYLVVTQGISYKVLGYRNFQGQLDRTHLAVFTAGSSVEQPATPEALGKVVLSGTAASLSFRIKYNSLSDPNAILRLGEGHCRMYSYVASSAFNQLAKPKKLGTCRVAYGLVYFYGVNLHQFLNTPFFRDHDFCVVRTRQGVYAMDAILYDYLRVTTIPLRS